MNKNKKQKLKLTILDGKTYIVSLDNIKIVDKGIVTVGGQYPSIVECNN